MTELKPCPFCGGEAYLVESRYGGWFATCGWCGAEVGDPNSKIEAVENWNRRTTPETDKAPRTTT